MMKVAVDFDATLWDIGQAISRLPGYEHVARTRLDEWSDLGRLLGDDEQMRAVFARVMTYEAMSATGLVPDAAYVLREAAERGCEIHILTSRPPQVAEATRRVIEEAGIPISVFRCEEPIDKIAHCQANDVRVLVDDHPDTIAAAYEAGIIPLTLRHPYNDAVCERLAVPHARSWKRLRRHLHAALRGAYTDRLAA